MKSIFFTIFCCSIVLNLRAQSYSIFITSESTINIRGYSNINKFNFTYNDDFEEKRLIKISDNKNNITLKNAKIDFLVDKFSSGNSMMDKDYRKMLKSKEYPTIKLEIISILDNIKHLNNGNSNTLVSVVFTIAGYSRADTIPISYQRVNGLLRCVSNHSISLKDYKIIAPQKLMGAIKVKDNLDIDLLLYLKID